MKPVLRFAERRLECAFPADMVIGMIPITAVSLVQLSQVYVRQHHLSEAESSAVGPHAIRKHLRALQKALGTSRGSSERLRTATVSLGSAIDRPECRHNMVRPSELSKSSGAANLVVQDQFKRAH